MIEEIAPAKVNLYLHVGPVRDDGLHELSSLFVFTEDGDRLSAAQSETLSLKVTGPFAEALSDYPVEDNLVFQTGQLLRTEFGVTSGAAMSLEKRLPVAAGIGGGSADAAAAFRALVKLWNIDVEEEKLMELAFQLGADIPACLTRMPLNVGGAGEKLSHGPKLPPLWACLANPRVEVPTGAIFKAFDAENPSPQSPQGLNGRECPGGGGLSDLFANTKNDLEPYAIAMEPLIAETLQFLAHSPDVLVARMSGSGATCFALFHSLQAAQHCARLCLAQGWWAMASRICD